MSPKLPSLQTAHSASLLWLDSSCKAPTVSFLLLLNCISKHVTEVVHLTDIKKKRIIKLKVDKFLSNYLFWAMDFATKSFRLY